MIWVTSDNTPTVVRCVTKLLLPDRANFKLGIVSFFLVAGGGAEELVLTVVLFLVLPTAQIVGPMAVLANRELSPRLSPNPVQVWPAFFQQY